MWPQPEEALACEHQRSHRLLPQQLLSTGRLTAPDIQNRHDRLWLLQRFSLLFTITTSCAIFRIPSYCFKLTNGFYLDYSRHLFHFFIKPSTYLKPLRETHKESVYLSSIYLYLALYYELLCCIEISKYQLHVCTSVISLTISWRTLIEKSIWQTFSLIIWNYCWIFTLLVTPQSVKRIHIDVCIFIYACIIIVLCIFILFVCCVVFLAALLFHFSSYKTHCSDVSSLTLVLCCQVGAESCWPPALLRTPRWAQITI